MTKKKPEDQKIDRLLRQTFRNDLSSEVEKQLKRHLEKLRAELEGTAPQSGVGLGSF